MGGVWIAPIYSWYHASFDREPDIPGAPAVENVSALCHPYVLMNMSLNLEYFVTGDSS